MKKLITALAAAAALSAAACELGTGPGAAERFLGAAPVDDMFTTDRQVYSPGDQVVLRLDNLANEPLWYNLCFSALERRTNGSWALSPFQSSQVCTAELRQLDPGQTATFTVPLDSRLQPGEYRFRTTVERPSTNDRVDLVTNTFTIAG